MRTILTAATTMFFLVGPAFAQYSTPVRVINAPEESVPTQHPREPVTITASLQAGINSGGGILGNYIVPDDRRLVIEHVSFSTNFVTCTFTSSIRISNGSASFYANPMFPMVLPNSSTRFTRASQAMKLYAPPGAFVQMNWTRTSSTCVATGSIAISGYLEEDLQ